MTWFEELCDSLNVEQGSKFEEALCFMVNDLIFDETRTYTDDEIHDIVTEKFKKVFPYV